MSRVRFPLAAPSTILVGKFLVFQTANIYNLLSFSLMFPHCAHGCGYPGIMNIRSLIAAVALVVLSVSLTMAQDQYVPDEVLIKLDQSSSARRSSDSLANEGAKVLERFADLGWQRIKI